MILGSCPNARSFRLTKCALRQASTPTIHGGGCSNVSAKLNRLIRHSPASHPVWCDSPLVEVPSQENLIGTKRVQQSSIAGDHRTAKLQHQTAVEIEPQTPRCPLHPSGPPSPPHSIPDKMLNLTSESYWSCSKSPLHPGIADSMRSSR